MQRAGASPTPADGGEALAPTNAYGKAILFAQRDLVISNQFAALALDEALRTPWPKLADVSSAGTPIDAGQPILTLFAEAAGCDAVEQQLRTKAVQIRRQLDAGVCS